MSFSWIAAAGVRTVGMVLLLSAFGKAIAPRLFAAHILRLVSLPPWMAEVMAVALVGAEAALALPLILVAGPQQLNVAVIALLALFSIMTLRAWRLGRIEDCGCYGPLLRLSPPVSSALNLLMIALLALGLYRHTVFPAGGVHTILFRALGCGAVAVWMAVIAPLLPRILSPLRMDRPWPARWLPQVEIHTEGAHLIVFLKPDCPACQAWAKALGRLSVTPELSAVTIITPGNSQAAASLSRAARTPVVQGGLVRSWLMAPEVPMAVIVRGGTICEIWSKTLPETWVRRLRRSPAEISIME